jgi:hypothetical protein
MEVATRIRRREWEPSDAVQQGAMPKFDDFIREYSHERAHQALNTCTTTWASSTISAIASNVTGTDRVLMVARGGIEPPTRGFSARAADRERVNAQSGLADTHGNALPLLAAGADALIELQVITDHGDTREYVRAVANERRPL